MARRNISQPLLWVSTLVSVVLCTACQLVSVGDNPEHPLLPTQPRARIGVLDQPVLGVVTGTPEVSCDRLTETLTQPAQRKVDLLLLVDNSPAMVEHLERLKVSTRALADGARLPAVDAHLGAIAMLGSPRGPDHPLGLLEGSRRYLTAAMPNLNDELRKLLALPIVEGPKTALETLLIGLSPRLTGSVAPTCDSCSAPNICEDGGCQGPNWGFHRPDAALEILALTDEDDRSTSSLGAAITALRSQATVVHQSFVRLHLMLPGSCGPKGATFARWRGLQQALGGKEHDLCSDNHDRALTDLARRIFGPRDQFFLSQAVSVPSSVRVDVDGQPAPFIYDAASNSVTLISAPTVGATISIQYCR